MPKESPNTEGSTFKTLGAFLEAWRIQANLTQGELARKLEVHLRTYTGWEASKSVPSDENITALVSEITQEIEEGIDPATLETEALGLAEADREKPRPQREVERGLGKGRRNRVR